MAERSPHPTVPEGLNVIANGRLLRKTIARDERVAQLTSDAQLLYTYCIPFLDNEGRIPGEPGAVRQLAAPLLPWSDDHVEVLILEWTQTMRGGVLSPLVTQYLVDPPSRWRDGDLSLEFECCLALEFHGFFRNQPDLERYLRLGRMRRSTLPPPVPSGGRSVPPERSVLSEEEEARLSVPSVSDAFAPVPSGVPTEPVPSGDPTSATSGTSGSSGGSATSGSSGGAPLKDHAGARGVSGFAFDVKSEGVKTEEEDARPREDSPAGHDGGLAWLGEQFRSTFGYPALPLKPDQATRVTVALTGCGETGALEVLAELAASRAPEQWPRSLSFLVAPFDQAAARSSTTGETAAAVAAVNGHGHGRRRRGLSADEIFAQAIEAQKEDS